LSPDLFMRVGLLLWAVGVQVNEGVASLGAIMALVGAVRDAQAQRAFTPWAPVEKAWRPLFMLLSWGLLWSSLLGWRLPTGFGMARLIDWLGVPVAAWAVARVGARRLGPLAAAAAAFMLLSCLCAGLQHYGVWPAREAFNGWEWTRFPFDRVYEPAPGAEGRYLAGGLLFHRLRFAHVTSLGALLALAVALRTVGFARVFSGAVAVTGLASVAVFPGARAAFVAAVLACGVLLVALAASRKVALLSVGGVALASAALLAAAPALRARLMESASLQGSGDRAGLVRAGLAAVSAHPVVGVGPGHFKPGEWAPEDASHFAKEHGGKTHNIFLTAAAEQGILGAILLLWWLVSLGRAYWRSGGDARAGLAVLGLLVALGMLHDPLFHAEVSLAFALALGATRASSPTSASP
jgi:O-antigen ligase